ncbi:uncharacterized protein LOC116844469 [Odontomachus brunneus]|uniref:uncharacterized protein LOC116844469 n=1 Tax=Odontomachus brunneus TaxID=486640 RepID=UPI0013F24613|nr:uncharacterized protein LOC116844469 [Odontomachus brunneus]
MSSRIVTRGIGCTLTLLLVLSAQAIDYEIYKRDDKIKTQPKNDTVLSSRDLLERLNHVEPKPNYSLQEATEQLLHYGALLRTRILDTFGNLLYIHYDDFSVVEVEALRNVYRQTLERRYNIFHLVANVLRNPDMRPSKICADIYALAEPCLRSSANVCRGIRKRHDLPYPDDLIMYASNITYLAYRSSKISRWYPEGFSLPALLKFLHEGVLSITPSLLSGLLYHVRYDDFDSDILLAEREFIRYFEEIARTTRRSFQGILEPMSPKELRKHHSVASFLRYYIGIHVERFASDKLRRHALLIVKHFVDDVGTIDENIHLLGNVYENGTIHVGYLFDLVLPNDVLHNDVVGAKRYLVDKLNELDVLERYLRVPKYQQATPAHLVMEITGQLQEIGFLKDIATALQIHARFWHRSYMVESLYELLRLFDAYENLRQVARYQNVMKNLDKIRWSLSGMQDVPIEILCNAPRACLLNGLRMLLDCKLVSPEIKQLIKDFLKQLSPKGAPLDDECQIPMNMIKKFRRTSDIQDFDVSKISLSVETVESPEAQTEMDVDDISELETTEVETAEIRTTTTMTTTRVDTSEEKDDFSEVTTASLESYKSEENAKSSETTNETTEKISKEIELSLEESMESSSTRATERAIYETTEPIQATTTTTTTVDNTPESRQEETTTVATTTTTITLATTLEDEKIPNIDMKMEMIDSMVTMSETHDKDSDLDVTSISPTLVAVASKKSCESGECSSERSSEESSEYEKTSTLLSMTTENTSITMIIPTTQGFAFLEITGETQTTSPGPSSSQEVSRETTAPATSETPIAEGEKCTKSSCSGECAGSKSESIESSNCRTEDCSGKSCSGCDSLMEDCDGENSGFEDTKFERPENSTNECRGKVVCEKESSPEVSAECDTSQDERSDERCVKVCASREQTRSSCEGQDGDCLAVELPTVNLKFERARNQSVCEIQDPHHRRQMRRLARMRAISATTSRHDNVLESLRRWPRRRDRIASEKLYELLASRRPPRNENDRTRTKAAGYSSLTKMKFEEGGRKKRTFDRKQRDQLYMLREKLATRHTGGKSRQVYRSGRTSIRRGQTERISKRGASSIVVAPLRDSAIVYRDMSM